MTAPLDAAASPDARTCAIQGSGLLNDLKLPNSDGIDIDQCRNVRIANCRHCGRRRLHLHEILRQRR
ncbi:MAG: hypothetical protein IPK19_00005 [Chloroflexi bacterium]|nr:hypothetical protein [Chloroflexota bacterium]